MDEPDDYLDNFDDASYEDDYDIDVSDVQTPQKIEEECEVLNEMELLDRMAEDIQETSALLQLSPTVSRNLLNLIKWDRAKLCEQFYDCRAQLFKEAQITDPMLVPKITVLGDTIFCEICFSEYNINDCFSASCGHYFCLSCWELYLKGKILHEGLSAHITCPQHECSVLIEDASVDALIQSPNVLERFHKTILDSFVQCNGLMRPCPKPDCDHVIKVEESGMKPVMCSCTCEFCFSCGEEWHSPIKCDLLQKWKKKNRDDSETANWIACHTKDCPKCSVTIEKNGGCNHMICRNVNCNFEFCWVCLGQWSNHGAMWYNCIRYHEEDSKKNRTNLVQHRQALNRYMFYFTRYSDHFQSLKLEHTLTDTMQEVMEDLQKKNVRWIDVQFLSEAVIVLCNCRRTLMYTYVFLFYLERDNEVSIFEDNQTDLQDAVEKLSGLLEKFKERLPVEEVQEMQQQVQGQFRYCEARRQALIEHVKEGHEGDKWRFLNIL